MSIGSQPLVAARRQVMFGATALFATFLLPASSLAAQRQAGVVSKGGGTKLTYLPAAGSRDPVTHSIAENLFWNEQMMEHATFFIMLMPGPQLARQRAEAQRFEGIFSAQLARSRAGATAGNYRALNQSTISHARRFADFKRRMESAQASGQMRSLVWPTFFEHTRREATYFADRLTRLSAGDVSVDGRAATDFWARTMGEHAHFVAHLLDPDERALIAKATNTGRAFDMMRGPAVSRANAIQAVDQIVDFKTAAAQGINAGKIKSIIHPSLADHVRREAIKAADELRRAV